MIFALTQTQYYMTLLHYLVVTMGIFFGAVIFIGIVYGIVFYSHYWR